MSKKIAIDFNGFNLETPQYHTVKLTKYKGLKILVGKRFIGSREKKSITLGEITIISLYCKESIHLSEAGLPGRGFNNLTR